MFLCGTVALVEPFLRLPVAAALLLKAIAEFLVLSKGSRLLRRHLPLSEFLIAELCHVPYIAVAGLVGQFNSLRWKDRNLAR
jgi:hypothetical protein